jgi:hypothetical protein
LRSWPDGSAAPSSCSARVCDRWPILQPGSHAAQSSEKGDSRGTKKLVVSLRSGSSRLLSVPKAGFESPLMAILSPTAFLISFAVATARTVARDAPHRSRPLAGMATTAAWDALAGHGHNGSAGRTRRPHRGWRRATPSPTMARAGRGGGGELDEHGEEGKDADEDNCALLPYSSKAMRHRRSPCFAPLPLVLSHCCRSPNASI